MILFWSTLEANFGLSLISHWSKLYLHVSTGCIKKLQRKQMREKKQNKGKDIFTFLRFWCWRAMFFNVELNFLFQPIPLWFFFKINFAAKQPRNHKKMKCKIFRILRLRVNSFSICMIVPLRKLFRITVWCFQQIEKLTKKIVGT